MGLSCVMGIVVSSVFVAFFTQRVFSSVSLEGDNRRSWPFQDIIQPVLTVVAFVRLHHCTFNVGVTPMGFVLLMSSGAQSIALCNNSVQWQKGHFGPFRGCYWCQAEDRTSLVCVQTRVFQHPLTHSCGSGNQALACALHLISDVWTMRNYVHIEVFSFSPDQRCHADFYEFTKQTHMTTQSCWGNWQGL